MKRPPFEARDFGKPLEKGLVRAWGACATHIVTPRPAQFLSEAHRHACTQYMAWWLLRMVFTSKRVNPRYNRMRIAATLATWAHLAPPDAPCPLDRLAFERMAIDALHLLKMRGEV
ncbi:hypothetical protein [Methylogaea oryzae]|uniref:Uncharacterized protein n=1 Tax=Methylogaea oryzae TaxID=1295382 RepID=A0A8D4VRW1_9GAMM|nr:hypothetical protein [Methylogaea oryzae]BBL72137.1 hypothetical protein MoryE10_27430 [Methylogaea oryzae]